MKRILFAALLLIVVMIGAFVVALSMTSPICEINKYSPYGIAKDKFTAAQLDSIEERFANTTLLPEFRNAILTTLANYPDFEDVKIVFSYSSERTTMACRPNAQSALMGRRTYNVLINNNPDFEGILLSDVPTNAQIGVIAHELAHILRYESHNNVGIIQLGLMYFSDESKRIFERETDMLTISRGFGRNLKAWAQYSMYDSPKATQEYKQFKRQIYMNPSEIDKEMQRYTYYEESPMR